jgi:hypothetical protein
MMQQQGTFILTTFKYSKNLLQQYNPTVQLNSMPQDYKKKTTPKSHLKFSYVSLLHLPIKIVSHTRLP